MGTLSLGAFQRLYLLSAVTGFSKGVFGLKRLHKVAYLAAKPEGAVRPFDFRKHHFGQYSESLEDIKDQLISMGLIAAVPLDTAKTITIRLGSFVFKHTDGGNRFFGPDPDTGPYYRSVLKRVNPEALDSLDRSIEEFGYMKEAKLVEYCYSLPEFKSAKSGDLILPANVSGEVHAKNLDQGECESVELALNPKFVAAMLRIVEGLDKSLIDRSKVRQVAYLP